MAITAKDRRTLFAMARELGLDNDARHQVQQAITGKSSTTDMTRADAGALIAHYRKLIGPRKPKRAGRVPQNLDREPMLQKIEALLADMELSWEYAEGIAWRITGGKGERPGSEPGVRRMEWVRKERDLRAVIAALHVEHKKRANCTRIDSELRRLGHDDAWLAEQLPDGWPQKWRRNTAMQNSIVAMLIKIDMPTTDDGEFVQ